MEVSSTDARPVRPLGVVSHGAGRTTMQCARHIADGSRRMLVSGQPHTRSVKCSTPHKAILLLQALPPHRAGEVGAETGSVIAFENNQLYAGRARDRFCVSTSTLAGYVSTFTNIALSTSIYTLYTYKIRLFISKSGLFRNIALVYDSIRDIYLENEKV